MKKKRVDLLLVERELVPSREKAQALILAGKVFVDDSRADKAGKLVCSSSDLRVTEKDHPYVSRGGVKLEAALKKFNFSPRDLLAMDIGASTGGFTHCLVNHGAQHVFAVDVGYGQLAWELRRNPCVTSLERSNIRDLEYEKIGRLVDLVVIDASFISLKLIFPKVHQFLKPNGHVIALVKPQFEAGKSDVEKRGLVRNKEVHLRVQNEITDAAKSEGFQVLEWIDSAIEGKKSGNKEFFVFLQNSSEERK
ncbi:MAG: TlyA family RNA methyltransferase [SAR324 cluster bacterium]|nr:TlyA family RNA methyltransferase [SAR324 cluster bacterium]